MKKQCPTVSKQSPVLTKWKSSASQSQNNQPVIELPARTKIYTLQRKKAKFNASITCYWQGSVCNKNMWRKKEVWLERNKKWQIETVTEKPRIWGLAKKKDVSSFYKCI